jgi:hypothetical protein
MVQCRGLWQLAVRTTDCCRVEVRRTRRRRRSHKHTARKMCPLCEATQARPLQRSASKKACRLHCPTS